MGQVVIREVTFAEYQAASMADPVSTSEQILMGLFEAKGIVISGDVPAPPADIETDIENGLFRITQEQ
ncbi:hypothetical protein [Herbaspirillum huttiense]|uniref:Uncharacterized protein n=2 Tax=Herbaspirillum huttiense TaxID=863372 RepID=A0AAJ2HFI1_9BURK|nr:hypothetical protein [Herbaspirillum huttiense]MDR9839426.1 hypothetical protein [Herbaspirillum huttiense]